MAANPGMVIRIAANLAELKRNLAEGKLQIETTTAAMGKLASSLSGDRLIQNAHNIAAAVNQIGGAAKLTEAEQARVNSTLDRALQKYAALGREAPADLVKLHAETLNVKTSWEKADAALGAFGLSLRSLTLAGAAAGLVSAGKEAIAFSSNLMDLSASTGLTLGELQRLGFAGAQVGVDMETIARSVQRVQRELVGDAGAVAAFDKYGLSVDALLKMSPGAMFEEIARAIAKIPDPAIRSTVAVELMQKGGAQLLPLLTADIDKLVGSFQGVSDRAVEGADKFDDFMTRAKFRAKADIAEIIGSFFSWQGAIDGVAKVAVPGLDLRLTDSLTVWAGWFTSLGGWLLKFKDDAIRNSKLLYEGVKVWLIDRFSDIVTGIKGKIDAVSGFFKDLYTKVVGQSFVPDMVRIIGQEFGKLDGAMVGPASAAIDTVVGKFGGMFGSVGGLFASFGGKIPGLIAQYVGGPMGSALGGIAQGLMGWVSSTMSQAFSSMSTQAQGYASQIGGAYQQGMDAYGQAMVAYNYADAFLSYIGGGPSPERWTGIGQDEYDRRYGTPEGNYYGDNMPQLAGGTGGRYPDWGMGTPVTLHGKERVMTEAEGRGGGVVNIIINGVASLDVFSARRLAALIAPELPAVLKARGAV